MIAAGPGDLDPQVQSALVGLASAALVALIGGLVTIVTLLIQTKGHAKRADWQVSNNHVDDNGNPINQREEADQRHAAVMEGLETTQGDVRGVKRDLGRMDRRVLAMGEQLDTLQGRVLVVESTQQREEIERVRQQLRESRSPGGYHYGDGQRSDALPLRRDRRP